MLLNSKIRALPWAALVISSCLLVGCALYRYDPVGEMDIERLVEQGCKKGDRVTTTAEVNQVYEDALVLWNGRDPDTTFTVAFKGPGVGRKTKSLVGKSRYERAYDALQAVKAEGRPVDVTFDCKGERKVPVATRLSFRDGGGERIAYEF